MLRMLEHICSGHMFRPHAADYVVNPSLFEDGIRPLQLVISANGGENINAMNICITLALLHLMTEWLKDNLGL